MEGPVARIYLFKTNKVIQNKSIIGGGRGRENLIAIDWYTNIANTWIDP